MLVRSGSRARRVPGRTGRSAWSRGGAFPATLILMTLAACGAKTADPPPDPSLPPLGERTINPEEFLNGEDIDEQVAITDGDATVRVNGLVAFRADATGQWRQLADHGAFVRYSLHSVALPRFGSVQTVVSERTNAASLEAARVVERDFWARDLGRVVRLYFGPRSGSPGIRQRCPDFGWNTPPTPTLALLDC